MSGQGKWFVSAEDWSIRERSQRLPEVDPPEDQQQRRSQLREVGDGRGFYSCLTRKPKKINPIFAGKVCNRDNLTSSVLPRRSSKWVVRNGFDRLDTRPVLVEIKQAFHQIRSTYDSDHLAIRNHRQPLDSVSVHQVRRLFDRRVRMHGGPLDMALATRRSCNSRAAICPPASVKRTSSQRRRVPSC